MKPTEIIKEFPKKHILVMGDIMIDEYIFGNINRINPEAPVPILNVSNNNREHRLGGSSNTANNISALGAKCTLIGQVGNDKFKEPLKSILAVFNKTKLTFDFHHLASSNATFIDKEYEEKRKIFNDFKEYSNFFKKLNIVIDHEKRKNLIERK